MSGRHPGLSFVFPALALLLGSPQPGRSDELAEKGRAIYQQHQQAVVTVQVLVRSRVWIPGRNTQTNESLHSISGTVLNAEGLTAGSLSALDPTQALTNMAAARDPRLKVEAELKTVDILLADGSKMPAELLLREPDLDLALVRAKTKPAAPMAAVDLSQPGKAEVLDQVVALNRLGPAAGRGYSASAERIAAVMEQPRHYYIPDANMTTATLGSPAFTLDGKFLGIFLIRSIENKAPAGLLDSPGENLTGIILPADELLKAARQAAGDAARPAK